ncbi:MAG TPA: S41 family peptidase [Thermoanaerobaculia bacterium]|nr:S41 family peptidase [Thermoanaerobaculia bacterium]
MTKKKLAFLAISAALLIMLIGGAVFGQATQKSNIYRYLSIFSEVFDLVRSNYVEPVSSDQLMDGAFNGVTDAIDEFSYYVPPAQMAAYKSFVDADDNGIGIVLTKRFGYAYVITAIPDSPAAKAGIERGDFIEKVDGQPTQKLAIWQTRNLLHSGKAVHVQVLRGGQTKRDEFTLQPAGFHPVQLSTRRYEGVAYVKVSYFDKGTEAQFRTALEQARKDGIRKLIVDVRGNAGGDISEAIAAADDLLTSGMITSVEGKTASQQKWQADRATAYDGDVEVLTDPSTAAGAEIFAAAIKGNSRGKVVGVTTYGKSIVQRFIPLGSGGGVFMTVAHYTTPEMKPIKDGGIKPDVVVDLTPLAIHDPSDKNAPKTRKDLILEKALSLYGVNTSVVEPLKNAA